MQFIVIALTLLFLFIAQAEPAHADLNSEETSQTLDINSADATLLAEKLPGIGPAKAARIVEWREQNGSFKHIDQLQEVKGIGPKTLDKLRPYIRVGSEAAATRMRLEYDKQEQEVQTGIHRIINAATFSASPESIEALPARAWYRKSILKIFRTH